MFWGLSIESGKTYTQTVSTTFHISMAALEPLVRKEDYKDNSYVSLMLQHDKAEFMLCTLEQGRVLQVPLDLNFTEGEEITFTLNGKGCVHLSGYLCPEDFVDSDDEDEDDSADESYEAGEEPAGSSDGAEESSDEEAPQLAMLPFDDSESEEEEVEIVKGKRKKKQENGSNKKKKIEVVEDEDDDDSDDEDFLDLEAEVSDDEEVSSDEEEEEEDGEEDDEEEMEEEEAEEEAESAEEPVEEDLGASFLSDDAKSDKKKKKKKKEKTPEKKEKSKKKETPEKPAETPKQKEEEKPANGDVSSTEKKKKKKNKKNKDNKENGATPSQNDAKTEAKTPPTTGKQKAKKIVLGGGVVAEELKEGHGPVANLGKMVAVYYKGTLHNGKQFDATLSGKPFHFKLGKGEVIKGWDLGVKGMKVGGKRKLTIPPKMGYGSQRSGPIPPNSTLIFEVELKKVN